MLCLCTESCPLTSFAHTMCISIMVQTFQQLTGSRPTQVAERAESLPFLPYLWSLVISHPAATSSPLLVSSVPMTDSSSSVAPLIVSSPCSHYLFNIMPLISAECSLSQLACVIIYSFIIHSVHKHLFRTYSFPAWC